jgi:tetratricopeptide (TPR) repeat protein
MNNIAHLERGQSPPESSLPEILFRLGLAALRAGDCRAALGRFDDAIEADPGNAAYHCRRAETARRSGRLDEAEAGFRTAITLRPEYREAHRDLAELLAGWGRPAEAEQYFRAALELDPEAAEIHNNLGNLLKDLGRFGEAETEYRAALAGRPNLAEAECNLGNLLSDLGRRSEAEVCFRAAIRLRSDLPEAHNNLGNLLRDLNRPAEAVAACREAIRLRPNYASAFSNMANALRDLGQADEAESAYRAALRIAPGFATAHSNLATILLEGGRFEEAIPEYRAAVALDPDYADAHNNLGIALLLGGAFEEGWRETEWRWRLRKNADVVKRFPHPRWAGEATGDKVLLIHSEQGFGDTVQFCRYVPLVAAGHRVILEVQRPLVPLLANLPGIERIVAAGDPLPAAELCSPLLSLPGILGTTLETIPSQVPYLAADPVRREAWRRRLCNLPGLKVGLVWAGNPSMAADRQRSIPLAQLAPLADLTGVSWVSLQKGEGAKQATTPPSGLVLHDWTTELRDFADTAALIDALDLVIGVDTAVVHVAGALGRPVWLLNRFEGCWRWLRGRDDSPWYPTLRQFRQRCRGDWSEAVTKLAMALAGLAATSGSAPDPEPVQCLGPVSAPVTRPTISFETALQHHRSGRWQEAEEAYRNVLGRHPDHADCRHLLGVLALQRGAPEQALPLIEAALKLKPDEGSYHGNLGLVLKALARRSEAEAALRRALALKPLQPDVLNNLANLLNDAGRAAEAEPLYREALRLNPGLGVARASLGGLLQRGGRMAEAVEHYAALAALRPRDAAPRRRLAMLLQAVGRLDEAIGQYREALQIGPDDAAVRVDLGNLLKERGHRVEAEAQYRQSLALYPDLPAALVNLANLVNENGHADEAERLCRQALRVLPNSAEALNNLGLILKDSGRIAEAESCYRDAIRLRPNFPEPLNNLGDLLREQERLEESERCCREAIRIRPHYASAHNNFGNTLWMFGRLDEAETSYRESLRLKPDFPSGLSNLGTVLIELDRHAEAEAVLRQALSLDPKFADAHCNLGVALIELGQAEEAVHHYREALRIRPSYAEAHSNLGSVLQNRGDLPEAIEQFRAAIRHKPNYPDGHNNLAIALLLAGELTEGWREYEWRWQLKKQRKHVRPFKQPLWTGESTGDGVLLLHAEQGFGDTLQFCRYAPLVAAQGHRVVLEVQRALVPLLTGLPGVERVVSHGDSLPEFDVHCPLLSLPGILGTTHTSIPRGIPYLRANPDAVAAWRTRLSSLPGKKVGLVWAGNPAMAADRRRSLELEQLAPLAGMGGVSFVSLQKGPPAAQATAPPARLTLHDWTRELPDFAATAALIEALDLVIGVDTSVIHVAGALGKPVWLLNRFDCCWRWLKGREDSDWYPSLRQFRQTRSGDWRGPIAAVTEALKSWA